MARGSNALGCLLLALLPVGCVSYCMNGSSGPDGASYTTASEYDGGAGAAPERVLFSRYVQASTLNCRDEPNTAAGIQARLSGDDRVDVVDTQDGWSRLSTGCWVASRYLGASRRPRESYRPQRFAGGGGGGVSRPNNFADAGGPSFANCSQARAAGYSNLRVGEPGYRRRMDRDGDGVACES